MVSDQPELELVSAIVRAVEPDSGPWFWSWYYVHADGTAEKITDRWTLFKLRIGWRPITLPPRARAVLRRAV